ncbi:MAG: tetraacyldisaccharide 4'-kinase [Hyphomicrobiaceae bacterium]
MPRRAPSFWSLARPTGGARLLRPIAAVYGAIAARRMAGAGYRSRLPVVCVGNFTAGGAGKTPTALWIASELQRLGRHPVFLTRGYGGSIVGPYRVDPRHDTAGTTGDEPLLLAKVAPAVVARDRGAGARFVESLEADVIVMDDGLQNPSLEKQLTIAVVDAGAGLGNGLVIPAGPLRAPLAAQIPRVQAIVSVGVDGEGARPLAITGWTKPIHTGSLLPVEDAAWLRSGPIVAFAGIGRPEKFFATLRQLGADLVATQAFPDHHAFTAAEARALLDEARACGARLVTTEKDHVRLTGSPDLGALAAASTPLAVRLAMPEVSRLALLDLLRALPRV